MRILILPLTSLGNPTRDSNFRVYEDIMANAPDDYYFYMAVDQRISDEDLEKAQNNHPNCHFFRVEESIDFYTNSTFIQKEIIDMFAQRVGKYPIDLVITSKTSAVGTIRASLSDFRRKYSMPVHIFEPLVRVDATSNPALVGQMVDGYVNADTWFLNKNEMNQARRRVVERVSPSTYLRAKNNWYVDGLGINTEKIDGIVKDTEKSDRFQVIWGARMSSEKSPEIMLELMDKFYSFGRDVHHVITTHQESPHLKHKMKGGFVEELNYSCPQDEFWKKVKASHMFLCTSQIEGFPVGFLEQLYITKIGIFPDNEWVRSLIPKEYPFIYKGMTEAHTIIRYVHENYEKAYKQVEWISDWIRDNYNSKHVAERFSKRVDDQVSEQRSHASGISESTASYMRVALDSLEESFTWSEFLKACQKYSTGFNMKGYAKMGTPNRYEFYQWLLENGCTDTLDSAEPRFIKGGKK